MQLVSQEVSASRAAMTIIDGEEGAPGPVLDLLELRLDDIQDDGHTVLVVVPDDALVRVGGVAADHAILLAGKLGWVIGLDKALDLLLLHLHVLLLLLHGHDEASVRRELVLGLRLLHSRGSWLPVGVGLRLFDFLVRSWRLRMTGVLVSRLPGALARSQILPLLAGLLLRIALVLLLACVTGSIVLVALWLVSYSRRCPDLVHGALLLLVALVVRLAVRLFLAGPLSRLVAQVQLV